MEMPYPNYRLQADGPNETALVLQIVIQPGVGGPLPGWTVTSFLEDLKTRLAGDKGDVTVSLVENAISTTTL